MNKKPLAYFLLLLVIAAAFLFIFYGKVILSPNSYIFSEKGDGIKNYYTYAYFIKNNTSNTNFEGMNYPYGENIMYTDCHPLLAFVLKLMNQIFPGLSDHSIGILNFLLLISTGFTIIILYFIFRELKINYLLSILGAVGVTALSPQILRISGHLALSYSFFIPLTIYLLLLDEKGIKRTSLFFLLSLSILFFFFTHAYLGMIAATMVFTYGFISAIKHYIANDRVNVSKHLLLLLMSVLPVVLFYLFVKLTDTHVGRTTNPWGIMEGYAGPATVFVPSLTPFGKIKEFLFPNIQQPWEGWSYIGLSTMVGLIFYLLVSIRSSIKTGRIGLNKTLIDHAPLRYLLISSFFILAFSMFVPFRWNLEEWINYFNIIKQFRAIGRWAWVFYFISSISVIYVLNIVFRKLLDKKMNWLGYVLIILVPLFSIFEGQTYHTLMASQISQTHNLFDLKQTPNTFREDIEVIQPEKYQAMLPFPFFYIGSENYGKFANDDIYRLSFLFSYHLQLPFIGSFLSRTSIDESKKIMQLLASNFYHKRIRDDLPGNEPLLLLCQMDNLNATEKNYIKQAKILIERDAYSIYELPVEALFNNTALSELEQFDISKDHLFEKDGFLVSDTSLYFTFIDFEQPETGISFTGDNGCHSSLKKHYNTIFSVEGNKLELNKKYTTRFWMYNEGENYGQDCLAGLIFFQKRTGDKVEWISASYTNAGYSHEIKDAWSLVEVSFECTDNSAIYDLVIKGDDISEKMTYLDDLLFYDNDLMIYKLSGSETSFTLFKNNHRIEIPGDNDQ